MMHSLPAALAMLVVFMTVATGHANPRGTCEPAPDSTELRRGRILFLQCAACHGLTAGDDAKVGPHLAALLGRKAGSVEGFRYSAVMASAELHWNRENLDRWLESPQTVLPGNVMAFGGIASPSDRKSLVDYLVAATDPACEGTAGTTARR